jgi:hypothetical protein
MKRYFSFGHRTEAVQAAASSLDHSREDEASAKRQLALSYGTLKAVHV